MRTPREPPSARQATVEHEEEKESSQEPAAPKEASPQVNNLEDLLSLMQPAMSKPAPKAVPKLDFGAFTTKTTGVAGEQKKADEDRNDSCDDGFDDFEDFVEAPSDS